MKTHSRRRDKGQGIRQHISQEAARLLATQECPDFQSARRKAAAHLGCRDQRLFPDNREIESALREYQRLFKGDSQPQALKYLRQLAIEAMESLHAFSPRLTGAVLAGTADYNSPLQLYLFAETPDAINLYLMERRIPYRQREIRLRYANGISRFHPVFDFRAGEALVELIALAPGERSNPPLDPASDRPDSGATLKQVRALLG